MNVEGSKVTTELLLFLDANVLEVLVPEDDHPALSDEQG